MITEQQPGTNIRIELFEIVDQIEKAEEADRVELMQKFGSQYTSFKDYLRCVFDERIQFLLPEGKPPYKPNKNPQSTWHKQHMQLKFWVKGMQGEQSNPIRREKMFLDMLESVHPDDALLLVDMLSKKTPSKVLTRELVEESFPNLIA